MPNLIIYLLMFLLGGFGYGAVELLFRQRTHWTMVLLGGVCCLIMYIIDTRSNFRFWQKIVSGAAVITTLEFCTGCVINILLKMDIWNYSRLPFNLFGQISLPFTALWLLVAVLTAGISGLVHRFLGKGP